MIIVGERLNSSRRGVFEALQERDEYFRSELIAAEALLGKDPSLKNYLKFMRSQSPSWSS